MAQPTPLNGKPFFIGAELAGHMAEPGKLKIILQTFYHTDVADIPNEEAVTISGSDARAEGQTVKLEKVSEFIDVKYGVVNSGSQRPLAVKIERYETTVTVTVPKGIDLSWTCTAELGILNNVHLNNGDAIVLKSHVAAPEASIFNSTPVINHLPVVIVNAEDKNTYRVGVQDNDNTDHVRVGLDHALVFNGSIGSKSKKAIGRLSEALKQISYRQGYSAEEPAGKYISYNKEQAEFSLDHLPFGSYLCALSIADYRGEHMLSEHKAIFILTSVL
jgi:hypothetical protein